MRRATSSPAQRGSRCGAASCAPADSDDEPRGFEESPRGAEPEGGLIEVVERGFRLHRHGVVVVLRAVLEQPQLLTLGAHHTAPRPFLELHFDTPGDGDGFSDDGSHHGAHGDDPPQAREATSSGPGA